MNSSRTLLKAAFAALLIGAFGFAGLPDAAAQNRSPSDSEKKVEKAEKKSKEKSEKASPSTPPYPPPPVWKNKIELTSKAFKQGEKIPQEFTDDGVNVSPPLEWKNLPKNTKDIVVMMEDPDGTAGNFNHWIIYGIPPDTNSLPKGIPAQPTVSTPKAKQGRNGLLRIGYAGPAPVPGTGTHHYTFRIFALDKKLDMPEGAWKDELAKNMYGHVLAQGLLMGTYSRPEKVGKKKP